MMLFPVLPMQSKFDSQNRYHSDEGPALTYGDGSYSYYWHGELHRLGGPATVDKTKNVERWYINGLRHRLDGPAVVWPNGSMWYINGKVVDKEIREWATMFAINLNKLSDEDKQMIALYWADYGK